MTIHNDHEVINSKSNRLNEKKAKEYERNKVIPTSGTKILNFKMIVTMHIVKKLSK